METMRKWANTHKSMLIKPYLHGTVFPILEALVSMTSTSFNRKVM